MTAVDGHDFLPAIRTAGRILPPHFPQMKRWLAAVAVALFAVISLLVLRRDDAMKRLVALAPSSARAVEARLTGGFPWAAYAGPHRAAGETQDAQRLKLGGAAG